MCASKVWIWRSTLFPLSIHIISSKWHFKTTCGMNNGRKHVLLKLLFTGTELSLASCGGGFFCPKNNYNVILSHQIVSTNQSSKDIALYKQINRKLTDKRYDFVFLQRTLWLQKWIIIDCFTQKSTIIWYRVEMLSSMTWNNFVWCKT